MARNPTIRLLAVVLTTLTPHAGLAGAIVEAAGTIEQKIAAKDMAGALLGARDLYASVWSRSASIGFTQALLVSEPAPGFGMYNPRADNVFKKGEPILIYCEPYGVGYGNPGEGVYSVNFIIDLQVLDSSGNQLANVPDTTEYTSTSRHQNKEVQANITYTLDGLQPGAWREG
ncbi:MAG: hypothetical protein ABI832_17330 [bacterium]